MHNNRQNKTPAAGSQPQEASSKKEKRLFHSATAQGIFAEDDPPTIMNKTNRKNLTVLDDLAKAKIKIRAWITVKVTHIDKTPQPPSKVWKELWGEEFTPSMKNLGKVIGEQYVVGEVLRGDTNNQLALYRIDYAPDKAIHYNVEIKTSGEKYWLPINLPSSKLIQLHADETPEESQVIKYYRLLTINYLKSNVSRLDAMPYNVAMDFLKTFKFSEDRSYFKACGSFLRILLKAAIQSVMQINPTAYDKIELTELASKATNDIFTFWSDKTTEYLNSLKQSKTVGPFENNKVCLKVLGEELKYISNNEISQSSRDIVLVKFSDYFSIHTKGEFEHIIKLAVDYSKLGDYQIYANLIRKFRDLSPVTPPADSKSEESETQAATIEDEKKVTASGETALTASRSSGTPAISLPSSSAASTSLGSTSSLKRH